MSVLNLTVICQKLALFRRIVEEGSYLAVVLQKMADALEIDHKNPEEKVVHFEGFCRNI